MSEEVERRILSLVEDGATSPYGNPVPGLEELGVEPAGQAEGRPSTELGEEGRVEGVVTRLGEAAQVDPEVLGLLLDSGVRPGARVVVWAEDGRTIIEPVEGQAVSLPLDVAAHIFCR